MPVPNNEEAAIHTIDDMIDRAKKAQMKFSEGTSQHTLQENRIHSLNIARKLILRESEHCTAEDFERAKAPLISLISKSEKAQAKLKADSWQYKMLERNLAALYMARELLDKKFM